MTLELVGAHQSLRIIGVGDDGKRWSMFIGTGSELVIAHLLEIIGAIQSRTTMGNAHWSSSEPTPKFVISQSLLELRANGAVR